MLARHEVSGGTLVLTARWSLYGGTGSMAIEFEMWCFGLVKMVSNSGELGPLVEARRSS